MPEAAVTSVKARGPLFEATTPPGFPSVGATVPPSTDAPGAPVAAPEPARPCGPGGSSQAAASVNATRRTTKSVLARIAIVLQATLRGVDARDVQLVPEAVGARLHARGRIDVALVDRIRLGAQM